MARIAFAWEFGGEFGHAISCAMLARSLEAKGHTIAFMFRELHQLASLPGCDHYDVFQAPVSPRAGENMPAPASMADILLGCGYDDARALTGLAAGWRALFQRWQADLVVADYAPTALLAARLANLPRVTFGNGFSIPPRLSPLPPFRYDAPIDPRTLAAADARALASVNAALANLGGAPLATLAQLFEADEHFLCTFPEIDQYGARPTSAYWGPRFSIDTGVEVRWPYGDGKRVIVYVRDSLPQLDALIEALAASRYRVAAFIPGLTPERRERLRSARRVVAEHPMRLKPLLESCDLFVSHGGNVAPGALMAGVPQLLFPTQYEQYLTAVRMEQVGSGLWLRQGGSGAEVAPALARVLNEPRFAAAARAFARRYAAFSPAEQQRRIVLRIEQVLAKPPILSPSSTP